MARAACRDGATPRNLELRDRAEDNLNALLDFRSGARRRRIQGEPSPDLDPADRLPA
jgi:hypothetical protein